MDTAASYCRAGWALVGFARGTKGPTHSGWNLPENVTTDPVEAELLNQNIGLCHAYSGTCCLDLDDLDLARPWLAGHGITLDALLAAPDAVRISSGRTNRGKLLYRVPASTRPLYSKKPKNSGLELRCAATTGLSVQDVLPPSIHPKTQQPYTWEYNSPEAHWSRLPVLPAALHAVWLTLLGPEQQGPAAPPQGLAPDRIRGLLANLDPDCGYDEWLKAGMALHHETEGHDIGLALWDEWSCKGVKYKSTEDLAQHYNSFGRTAGRQITIGWLVNEAGGVSADDFEDLTQIPEPAKRQRLEIVPLNTFIHGPPIRWIIKNVLVQGALGVIYGESGAGKSFAVLDACAKVAAGEPWNQQRVNQTRVVYVAAEGQAGMRKRVEAYGVHSGVDLAELPIGVVPEAANLLKNDHQLLAQRIKAWGGAGLVVIDTLAQSMPGGDENGSEDMGKVIQNCQALHALTGAMVLLVHHSGKDATKGARGWSGVRGALDTELEVTREGDKRLLRVSKQKDGQDGLEFPFELTTVRLGQDEDGDDITSCVVTWRERSATQARTQVGAGAPSGLWPGLVWRAAQELASLADGVIVPATLVAVAAEKMVKEPGKRDRRKELAWRAVGLLLEQEWLVKRGENVALKSWSEVDADAFC